MRYIGRDLAGFALYEAAALTWVVGSQRGTGIWRRFVRLDLERRQP